MIWMLVLLTLGVATVASANDASITAPRDDAAATAPGAQASEPDQYATPGLVPAVGSWEAGLQTAYNFGITNNAQMVTFFPRIGRVVTILDGPAPGIVTFGVEGMFSYIYETSENMELGGGLLLRYRMAFPHVQPYAELEGGMLYEGLRHFSLGSNVLFTCQGAVGLQFPISDQIGLNAGYRFRHISNAGQSPSNPGLNSNLLIAGVTYAF